MTTKHATSGSNIQRLKDAVVSLSEADVFGLARLEWDVVGRYEAPMGEGGTRCVCGHDPISECFKIRNRENGNVLEPIGNVCVRHFESFAMDSQMAALSGAARVRAASAKLPDGETLPLRKDESPDGKTPFSRHAIEGLYLLGAFGPREKNGLEINSLIDERRDPVKATHAACRYFEDMYAIYKDWNLVLAAYNCGPGNVNKAIRRSGGKTDFWEIFPYLPKETRSYVPLFIAANYIMTYHCEHNLCALQTSLPLATDTVVVNRSLHFEQVSDLLQVDMPTLRALNPQYKRDIVPGNVRPLVLKLPAERTYAFIDKEDTVYTHRAEELLANCIPVDSGQSLPRAATRETITHIVLKGENLYTIANRYGVTARDIRKWNRLSSNRVARGKRLKLYVDNGGVYLAAKGKEKNDNATAKAGNQRPATAKATADGKGFVSYKVRSGDSLYSISKKYPGVTAATLQKVNKLSGSNIQPGQILKIPVG